MAERNLKPIKYRELLPYTYFAFRKNSQNFFQKKLSDKAYTFTFNTDSSIREIEDPDMLVYVDEKYFPNPLMLWLKK